MDQFFTRRYVIQASFLLVALIFLIRLLYIQLVDNKYILSANNNVLRKVVLYPARGVILDRHGKGLVQNEPVYDLIVIPNEVKDLDTLFFCDLVGISKEKFMRKIRKAIAFSPYKASVFEKQISATDYAKFQELIFQFKGFYVQNRSVRYYPDSIAAQFLGYIGEVTESSIKKSKGFYRQGDYIGISGVEKAYEDHLRGQRGVQNILVDALNRPQGSFSEGEYDTLAVAGEHLVSSLDKDIQKLGEQLMKNKIGSIVAIEPATGEVLAFVSSPSYDPNLMVGRNRGDNYNKFFNDPYKPMFIRPLQAYYPPGSMFKPVEALIGLEEGAITTETKFPCGGGYKVGNHVVKCEHVHPPLTLVEGISESCNPYFCAVFRHIIDQPRFANAKEGYLNWKARVSAFGIGINLGIDLPNEKKGILPSDKYYDKIFGKNRWNAGSIVSLAIGQGELSITPLQMANIMCIIANRGYYYTPHLIKAIGERKITKPEFLVRHSANIKYEHFEPVIEGMQRVVEHGTAYGARIKNIIMCGKTGTVQNPHGKSHSVFAAFAPKDNPKIAIAVIVENAGYGASYAAPIASYIVEQYLTGKITKPKAEVDWIKNAYKLPHPRVSTDRDSLKNIK